MPTASSITIKKADGTTDIVYDLVTASGGDNSPVVYRQDTGAPAGLPVGLRPTFRLMSKWNGAKSARVLNHEFEYPYAVQNTTTTRYESTDKVVFKNGSLTAPQNIPSNIITEATAQYCNLIGSTAVKAQFAAGYAAT